MENVWLTRPLLHLYIFIYAKKLIHLNIHLYTNVYTYTHLEVGRERVREMFICMR